MLWPLVVLTIAVLALRHVASAKDVADLISATASLLWPIIAFTVISWFRPELRGLLARIRKGKFLGARDRAGRTASEDGGGGRSGGSVGDGGNHGRDFWNRFRGRGRLGVRKKRAFGSGSKKRDHNS